MPNGSSPAPIAERAWRPASPHRARIKSLKPLIAAGVVESLRAPDEAKRLDPAGHAVELAEFLLERGEDGQACRARSLVGLLDGDLASDGAGDEQAVAVERPVA